MSFKDITAGDKIGKPISARLIESKAKGSVGMEIAFRFEQATPEGGTSDETLTWVGWLTAGAMQYTMKTLVDVLEFNGNEDIDDNGVLIDPAVINFKNDVRLVVDFEENPSNGKSYPRIQFVNSLTSSPYVPITKATVKAKLAAVGLKAAFLAARQEKLGGRTQPAAQQPMQQQGFMSEPSFSEEDIPF